MIELQQVCWNVYNCQQDGEEAILKALEPVSLSDEAKQKIISYIEECFLSHFWINMKIIELLKADNSIVPNVSIPPGWKDIVKSSKDKPIRE